MTRRDVVRNMAHIRELDVVVLWKEPGRILKVAIA